MIVLPVGDEADDAWDLLVSSRTSGVRRDATRLPLEYAQGLAEEQARASGMVIASAQAAWRSRPPTAKQVAALRAMTLPVPGTAGEASDLMSARNATKVARAYLRGVAQ